MTSAMMATLVAEDKIKWETSLIEVFPELEDSILSEYQNITLHQLLTHRAGIANECDQCMLYEDLSIEESRYLNMITVLKERTPAITELSLYSIFIWNIILFVNFIFVG